MEGFASGFDDAVDLSADRDPGRRVSSLTSATSAAAFSASAAAWGEPKDRSGEEDDDDEDNGCGSLRRTLTTTSQISAMLSNFATSYNVAIIAPALPILARLYESSDDARDKDELDSLCASSLLGGMVLGQILGGTMGDVVGRTNALIGAVALQVAGSLGSATVTEGSGGGGPWGFFERLAAWRFVLGVGAGAVYPLAAVLSAEQRKKSPTGGRGGGGGGGGGSDEATDEAEKDRLVAITFSTQGVGFLCAPLVVYPLLLICGENNLDVVWRTALGLGAVPGVALLLLQFRERRRRNRRRRNSSVESEETDEEVQFAPVEEEEIVTRGRGGVSLAPFGGGTDDAEGTDGDLAASLLANPHLPDGDVVPSSSSSALRDRLRGKCRDCLEIGDNRNERRRVDDERIPDADDNGDDLRQGESPADLWSSLKSEPDLPRKFLGTAGSWFLFDVLFYGNTLFQPVVLEGAFGKPSERGAFDDLARTARDELILSLIALPGYAASIALMGRTTTCCRRRGGGGGGCAVRQTPRYIQCQGFAFMSILYIFIGSFWRGLTENAAALLVLLYGLTFFFANYGPNTTTFMLPSLTYGRRCRSTLNGLSAAAGKAGALLGATMFEPAADRWGDDKVMLICGGVSLLGLALTLAFVARGRGSH